MTRLTADQLNITQPEYDALIWVRDALDPTIPDTNLPNWMVFDMNSWGEINSKLQLDRQFNCGTGCCIGGSMEMHLAGVTNLVGTQIPTSDQAFYPGEKLGELTGNENGSSTLYPLFYRYPGFPKPTREDGVAAIDRFLSGNTTDPWLVRE